ncbi:MAG: hypothetical protein ACQ9ET_00020 [Nitrosomonadaceae bacterium]
MARTIEEIYDALITEKESSTELLGLLPTPDDSQTLLADLTTTSKVAIWRLTLFVVAVGIWSHEKLFDEHTASINALVDVLIVGTPRWIRERCFEFQLGDSLTYDSATGRFIYSTIDTAVQIVKRASVLETLGQVRIKVAKLDVSDNPIPLTASELNSFNLYVNQIAPVGTNILSISRTADLLKVAYDVTYDQLVLASDGSRLDAPTVFPIEDAINTFIGNLPFDGVLNLTQLTDAVQAADGVVDPVITTAEARFGAVPFAVIDKNYTADAGYMAIDPAFPLSTQITYIPQSV